MSEPTVSLPSRRKTALLCVAALAMAGGAMFWSSAQAGQIGPDVTVIYLGSTSNYGTNNGVRAYSVGTTSCNTGDEPVWWCDDPRAYCDDDQHPVIAQNMYRLKDGRFEQVGISWLKHGFLSTNSTDSNCGNCQIPEHGGDQLGLGCTDTYGSGLNGNTPLGMRSEVNATDGTFPFPETTVGTSTAIDQRLQVDVDDVDPAQNAGARYWVEGHYITADDARFGNGLNNASYREVTVSSGSQNLSFAGGTIRELPAIAVWPTVDPSVDLVNVDIPSSSPLQRFHVARKVTSISGGYHYEFAVHNMNSHRSAREFTVSFPGGATITNAGMHDVPHHSGEPYAATTWTTQINGNDVTWFTDEIGTDANANALRWGTMFNFWFDSTVPPDQASHTLGLFRKGSPTSIGFNIQSNQIFGNNFETGDLSGWPVSSP